MEGWRLVAVISCIPIVGALPSGYAQTTTTPSAHFGAIIFPRDRPGYELGVHFNRFTEFDKVSTLNEETGQPIRYNEIDRTYGFNLAALAVTNRLPSSHDFLYRLALQTGVTANEPTQFLQNELIHDLRGIPHVPVGDTPTQFDVAFSAELNRWFGHPQGGHAFGGAGVSLGTINQDLYVQTGFQTATIRIVGHPVFRLSAVARAGTPAGGFAFKDGEISNLYGMAQGYGTSFIAHNVCHVFPVVDWGVTYSTGFFVDATGDPISEFFWTIRFWWPDGITLETWNDSLNDKDRGPTYGLRLTTMLDSIPILDGLFGM